MDTSLCGVDPQADQIGLNFYREVRGPKSGIKQPRFNIFRNLQSPITLRSLPVIQIGDTSGVPKIRIRIPNDLTNDPTAIDPQEAKGEFSEKLEINQYFLDWRMMC